MAADRMRTSTLMLITVVIGVVSCEENGAFEAGNTQGFKFGQSVDDKSTHVREQISSKQKFLYTIEGKKHVAVYEKLLDPNMLSILQRYLSYEHDSWVFNDYDTGIKGPYSTQDDVPWANARDPISFANTSLSKVIVDAIKDMSGNYSDLYPYQVQGRIIRRGDHTKVVSDSMDDGDFSALIYLNNEWKKNWYGETYFYDNSKEIMCGVTPKFGRLVTWDASLYRLTRPPAVTFNQGQVLFHVTYSPLKDKMMKSHVDFMKLRAEKIEATHKWYLPGYSPAQPDHFIPDPAKHLTKEYKTKQGKRILVFDGLFPDDLLYNIREHVLRFGSYFYDDSIDDPTSDNVQWIAAYPMYEYIKSPYWNITREVVKFASGRTTMFPYDVSINLIRSLDHTRIHTDCSKGENEWTFLVYLNPGWTESCYGETVFLESKKFGSDVAAEVIPKFGRVALFEGIIPHSARPPSPNFKGARLSFATKLSVNEAVAREKCLRQEMNHFTSLESNTIGLRKIKDGILQDLNEAEDVQQESAFTQSLKNDLEEVIGQPSKIALLHDKMKERSEVLSQEINDLFIKVL